MPDVLPTMLADVCGGAAPPAAGTGTNDFGRCGPGSSWQFLGNIYTPQCAAHDAAVRGAEAKGWSGLHAELHALPLLPAAVGSYIRGRFFGH